MYIPTRIQSRYSKTLKIINQQSAYIKFNVICCFMGMINISLPRIILFDFIISKLGLRFLIYFYTHR